MAHRIQSSIAQSVLALVTCVAGLLPTTVQAQCTQTGPFQNFTQRWRDASSGGGIVFVNGSTIIVDTNGNGNVSNTEPENTTYTLPVEAQGTQYITALSPTREFFVQVGGAAGSCPGNRTVRIYKLIPASATMTLVHQDCLPCTVFDGPYFYDLGAVPPTPYPAAVTPQRIMYFRTGTAALCSPSNEATPLFRWYDMTTSGPSGIGETSLGLQPGVNTVTVSQSGYQAFIQHDLTLTPETSDFTMVNLCPGPEFGHIIDNQLNPPINDWSTFPLPIARTFSATPTEVVLQMAAGGNVVYQATVPNCCAGGGAPVGACCINGGCVQTTQAQCSTGNWSAGVSCASANCPPPPIPQCSLSIAAPAQVVQRDFIDYTITYANTGGAAAQNVSIRNLLPSTTTFISASNGGVYASGTGQITWALGTLPAQSGNRTVTFRVQTGCTIRFISSNQPQLTGTGISVFSGMTINTYNGMAPVVGSASGSATSSTTAQLPLLPGSVVRHELTITNTSALQLSNIRLQSTRAGAAARFTNIIQHGAGTITFPGGSGVYMDWVGSLAPNQSTVIIVESTVNECMSNWETTTQLNDGMNLTVATECGGTLGSFPTGAAHAITSPVSGSVTAIEVPGIIGPVSNGSSTYPDPMQFVKGTPDIDIVIAIGNNINTPITAGTISVSLPWQWITSDPPFVGNVPPGFSYDEPNRRVIFEGTIPVGGLPSVTVRTRPDTAISGAESVSMDRTIPGMCSVILGSLDLVNMPEFPSGPVILGVESFSGSPLWIFRRGVDQVPAEFFSRAEIWRGMHRSPNGDIWLAGIPIFMLNPETLASATAPAAEPFYESLGLTRSWPIDIAEDPTDGSIVFLVDGRQSSGTILEPALIRYNRTNDTCTLITRDPVIQPTNEHADLLIDPAGNIFICNRQGLFRIPAGTPAPIPNGQVQQISVPNPTYTFGPGAGTMTTQKVHAASWDCDGSMNLLHATTFTSGMNPEGIAVDTVVYALSKYDIASNTINTYQPQVAANSYGQGPRQWPVEFAPQLPFRAFLTDSCLAQGNPGETLIGNDYYPYHSIFGIEQSTGVATTIEDAVQFHFRGAADMVYLNVPCGCTQSCDVNADGGADIGDIIDLADAIASSTGLPNGSSACTDFNEDGGADTSDVIDLANAISSSTCP